jgi:hypothetical protein
VRFLVEDLDVRFLVEDLDVRFLVEDLDVRFLVEDLRFIARGKLNRGGGLCTLRPTRRHTFCFVIKSCL